MHSFNMYASVYSAIIVIAQHSREVSPKSTIIVEHSVWETTTPGCACVSHRWET